MRRDLATGLTDAPKLPPGYILREAAPADAEAIAFVLSAAFQDAWDADRVRAVLLENADVPVTFVVEEDRRLVATASYQRMPRDFPQSGWVHFVGALPSEAGRKLGIAVTEAVVRRSAAAGHRDVYLTTDDHRLPAIRTYLRLGFEPDPWHESHAQRWETVLAALGQGRS